MNEHFITPLLSLISVLLGGAVMWGRLKKTSEVNENKISGFQSAMDKKVDKEMCEKEMGHGHEQFKRIETDIRHIKCTQATNAETLSSMNIVLRLLAQKQGIDLG